jgi:hypothetical protein
MIRIILSICIIIVIIVFIWRYFIFSEKKVRFEEKVDKIIIPNRYEIKEEIKEGFQNQNQNSDKVYENINPANFYTQDFNTPNFTSNVTDLRKFYSYDNPPGGTVNKVKDESDSKDSIIQDVKTDPAWLIPKQQIGNHLEPTSNYWSYKNEMPMNGGDFGGLCGYEGMGETYTVYNAKEPLQDTPDIHHSDDLRNGKGFPQKQEFRFNMSNV